MAADEPQTYDTAPLPARMTTFVPHADALGMQLVEIGDGRGVMRVDWREELVGDPEAQVIASGVVTAVLDHCCGLAIAAAGDGAHPTATLDLRIDYTRPAKPRMGVTVVAKTYKLTRSIGFVRAEAYDESPDDLVATAQATFMLNPRG